MKPQQVSNAFRVFIYPTDNKRTNGRTSQQPTNQPTTHITLIHKWVYPPICLSVHFYIAACVWEGFVCQCIHTSIRRRLVSKAYAVRFRLVGTVRCIFIMCPTNWSDKLLEMHSSQPPTPPHHAHLNRKPDGEKVVVVEPGNQRQIQQIGCENETKTNGKNKTKQPPTTAWQTNAQQAMETATRQESN